MINKDFEGENLDRKKDDEGNLWVGVFIDFGQADFKRKLKSLPWFRSKETKDTQRWSTIRCVSIIMMMQKHVLINFVDDQKHGLSFP